MKRLKRRLENIFWINLILGFIPYYFILLLKLGLGEYVYKSEFLKDLIPYRAIVNLLINAFSNLQ